VDIDAERRNQKATAPAEGGNHAGSAWPNPLEPAAPGPVRWAAILLMGFCALIAIAIVHSDNRLTCAIAVALFATGFALSSLLIAAYSRPFTGEISVKPDLLQEVVPSETAVSHTTPE
jgi:hypothetical protein